jgi:hypothetical protein
MCEIIFELFEFYYVLSICSRAEEKMVITSETVGTGASETSTKTDEKLEKKKPQRYSLQRLRQAAEKLR